MTTGHRYTIRHAGSRRDGMEVIHMSGQHDMCVVAPLLAERGGVRDLGEPFVVPRAWLEPAPMRYYSGSVPGSGKAVAAVPVVTVKRRRAVEV